MATLGTIYASSLFPGRAPAGWHTLQNFIGGATNPAVTLGSHEQLAEEVRLWVMKFEVQGVSGALRSLAWAIWSQFTGAQKAWGTQLV